MSGSRELAAAEAAFRAALCELTAAFEEAEDAALQEAVARLQTKLDGPLAELRTWCRE